MKTIIKTALYGIVLGVVLGGCGKLHVKVDKEAAREIPGPIAINYLNEAAKKHVFIPGTGRRCIFHEKRISNKTVHPSLIGTRRYDNTYKEITKASFRKIAGDKIITVRGDAFFCYVLYERTESPELDVEINKIATALESLGIKIEF